MEVSTHNVYYVHMSLVLSMGGCATSTVPALVKGCQATSGIPTYTLYTMVGVVHTLCMWDIGYPLSYTNPCV